MREGVKAHAKLTQGQRMRLFLQELPELAEVLIIDNRLRELLRGYCLNELPLHKAVLGLTLIQMILLLGAGPTTFQFDFQQSYIIPLAQTDWAYGILLIQILLLILGFVKAVNLFSYILPLEMLKAAARIRREEQSLTFKGESALTWQQKAPYFLQRLQQKSLAYELIFIILVGLTIGNPFLCMLLLIDLFTPRYELTFILFRATTMPWRLLLGTMFMLIILNIGFSLIYFGYAQDWVSGGDACSNTLTCFLLMCNQLYRGNTGFLSTTNNDYGYFSGDWHFSGQIVLDYLYILVIVHVVKVMFGGTIIDTFGEMRVQQAERVHQLVSKCFLCDFQRVELDIELEGFEQHVKEHHSLWHYLFLYAYLRRKDPLHFTALEALFFRAVATYNTDAIPQRTSFYAERQRANAQAK